LLSANSGQRQSCCRQKGINYDNAHFIALELSLLAANPVQVKLTEDLGQIVVYHEGKFVCNNAAQNAPASIARSWLPSTANAAAQHCRTAQVGQNNKS
jgi:hypothetical protein